MQFGQQTVHGTRGDRRFGGARHRGYRCLLVAVAALALVLVPSMALAASPHGDYAASLPAGTSKCSQCHRPHVAATSRGLFSIESTTGVFAQTTLCLKCHGYAGPARNAEVGFEPTLLSGHRVEDATGTASADLTNTCSGCHDAHTKAKGLPRAEINGQDVSRTVDANSWCWACHDPALPRNWSGLTGSAYYDALFDAASTDASGYPMVGTLRGTSAYTAGAHASIPASATAGRATGDCLWCHASHRAPNARDGLLAAFGPTAPDDAEADLCFRCHDQAVGGYGMGHVIQSADASLTAGSPVPCYECHNPHGSDNGNTAMISDALGQGLNPDPDSPGYSVQTLSQFCFSCHTSSEGYWWDSENGVMAPPEDIAQAPRQSVAGIDRLGGSLMLPVGPDAHTKDDLSGCSCHGTQVHAPLETPVSAGGQSCYMCHSVYEDSMEDGGADSTTVYHHVMGTGAGDGDTAFPDGSYPTSTADLYCMSCHADHDQFNGAKAFNLRADLTSAATTASTDYLASGTYGICISCHAVSLAKDTDNQKSDGLADTDTPKIAGGAGPGGFGSSAHSYEATSTFVDSTAFGANCSKCHNDEQPKEYQEGVGGRFGTHFSAVRRLLASFGGAPSDPLGELHCYGCHSEAGDITGGKTAWAGFDYYGVAAMNAAAEDVYDQFQLTGSTHPVSATASGSVECESCHNVHAVSATSPLSDPLNTYNPAAYATTSQRALFCLTCHDSDGGPSRTVSDATYVPYSVTLTDAPEMDKTLYGLGSHWVEGGSIGAGETVACDACHDNHGSDYEKLLGARDVVTGTNRINGQAITGNDNSVCYACHTGASTGYPAFTREAGTGYPMDGTWPGSAVYTSATAIHQTLGASADGDCKVCHDVHGTANVYDELTGTFTATNYTLCFSCHDGNTAGAANIAASYPASSGSLQPNAGDRTGHSGDARVGGQRVANPCYNCHNPHGSSAIGRDGTPSGLLVVTQISSADPRVFGDSVGEFDLRTAQGVRDFCLSCHVVNSAANLGYSGSPGTSVTIQNTAVAAGYNRLTQLKITAGNASRHTAYTGGSCLDAGCHPNAHIPQ